MRTQYREQLAAAATDEAKALLYRPASSAVVTVPRVHRVAKEQATVMARCVLLLVLALTCDSRTRRQRLLWGPVWKRTWRRALAPRMAFFHMSFPQRVAHAQA